MISEDCHTPGMVLRAHTERSEEVGRRADWDTAPVTAGAGRGMQDQQYLTERSLERHRYVSHRIVTWVI